jgi:DNA invertase Pin-like site-specific DNA recombinase
MTYNWAAIKKVALYARVSTDEIPGEKGETQEAFEKKQRQHLENQLIKLREYAKFREWDFDEYQEHGHGDDSNRPVFAKILKKVEAHQYQALIVMRTDRAARDSLQTHLLLQKLQENHAYFISAGEGLDTTTIYGEAYIKMAGIFAEMELKTIKQRVKAGMDRAKLRGTRTGNPIGRPHRILSKLEIQAIREQEPSISVKELARRLDVPRTTLMRFLEACEPGGEK